MPFNFPFLKVLRLNRHAHLSCREHPLKYSEGVPDDDVLVE